MDHKGYQLGIWLKLFSVAFFLVRNSYVIAAERNETGLPPVFMSEFRIHTESKGKSEVRIEMGMSLNVDFQSRRCGYIWFRGSSYQRGQRGPSYNHTFLIGFGVRLADDRALEYKENS